MLFRLKNAGEILLDEECMQKRFTGVCRKPHDIEATQHPEWSSEIVPSVNDDTVQSLKSLTNIKQWYLNCWIPCIVILHKVGYITNIIISMFLPEVNIKRNVFKSSLYVVWFVCWFKEQIFYIVLSAEEQYLV